MNTITIKENRSVKVDSEIIAMQGENNSTVLTVIFDFDITGKDVCLEFEKEDGKKRTTEVLEKVKDENGKYRVEYEVDKSLLDMLGVLKVQAVLRYEPDKEWKSYVWKMVVKYSICASDQIEAENPDFITEANKILNEAKEIKNLLIDTGDGTKFLSDDGAYKEIESGGVSDYDALTNVPVERKFSEVASSPIILRNLASGVYLLYGYYKANETTTKTLVAQVPMLAYVTVTTSKTYVQLMFSYNNQIQYIEITDDDYTITSLSFKSLLTRIEELEEKVA